MSASLALIPGQLMAIVVGILKTLAGAHAISTTLAQDLASEVMGNAIQAFVGGTNLMAWATFSLAVLAIFIARRTLKAPETAPA